MQHAQRALIINVRYDVYIITCLNNYTKKFQNDILCLQKIDMKEFSEYTLFGVIVHIGGLSGGHYYTYVKRLDDEQWDLCDDSYVKRVDLKDVISCNAYVLFYHKCPRDTVC